MSKEKKSTKQNKDDLYKYTTRDLGQEFIMKKKMIAAIFALLITLSALAVFIALYMDERKRVQQTYYEQYLKCVETTIQDIDSYNNAEGDLEFRYRRIVADMSSVNSFAFLIDDLGVEHKKTINEFYTIYLKYPEQMSGKMEEARKALEDINANLDKGYDEADELIASIYLKGN